jgi:transcriptional regulator with XRE-family HTH domain
MTPARFRQICEMLDLTQEQLGALLHITGRQARRYISGEQKIPPPTGMLLETIIRHGLDLAAISRAYDPSSAARRAPRKNRR